MKRQDELDLWDRVKDYELNDSIWWPDIFKELDMNERRGYYIIDKWNDWGLLNYGVSLRTSWIEDKSKWKL